MFRNRSISLTLVGLFLWTTACTYHRQLVLDEVDRYGRVQVTTPEGTETLREPSVVGDTLTGVDENDDARAIPFSEILEVEASGTKVAGTVALAVVGAALLAVVIALATYDFCVLNC